MVHCHANTMIALEDIKSLVNRIALEFAPERILLFGSHARAEAAADSDVDLLVVMPFAGRPVDMSVKIRLQTRPRFPLDLLVRTPEQIAQRLAMGDSFMRDILDKGQVLYEADHG